MNYFSDSSEWQWMFDNAIDWKRILPLYYPQYPTVDGLETEEEVKSFLKEILGGVGEWAGTSVREIGQLLDEQGAGKVENGRTINSEALERMVNEARELQVYGITLPQEYGGMELPNAVYMMSQNLLSRSCMCTSTLLGFYTSLGEMLIRYCPKEVADQYVPQIIEGKISGSMNLTEPECGSDLSAMKTSATLQEDGTYLLNGQKIFITNGGGGLAFVLAKVKGDPDTLDGISMFFVRQDHPGKEGANFVVDKAEEKMGMHGSFTTVVTYEDTIGELVGVQGEGFKYMLHLMNEARILVGIQALGGIEESLDYAENYAKERVAFGKPLTELPLMKRNLEDYATERDAIRALLADTMSWFDIYLKLDNKKVHTGCDLSDEEKKLYDEASMWTRKRTPLVKFYATEAYTDLSKKAVQVLGGYGFIKEYPVERYHRDSFGPLLYEGTSQIQALMALKDTLKYVMKDPKKFFSGMFFKHPTTALINGDNEWSSQYKAVHYRFKKNLVSLVIGCLKPEAWKDVFDPKKWQQEERFEELMTHAETLCWALSYTETLRVLCDHANKDSARSDLFMRYHRLIEPRLEAIYKDWEIRGQ
ncbi:MAG: acyl-CoA dehydrogenase family protein [Bdellovibrionota bacterium]|nr:acyl-CoA dehydrogenase family protein [Bdellovibrionota bacterium]